MYITFVICLICNHDSARIPNWAKLDMVVNTNIYTPYCRSDLKKTITDIFRMGFIIVRLFSRAKFFVRACVKEFFQMKEGNTFILACHKMDIRKQCRCKTRRSWSSLFAYQ